MSTLDNPYELIVTSSTDCSTLQLMDIEIRDQLPPALGSYDASLMTGRIFRNRLPDQPSRFEAVEHCTVLAYCLTEQGHNVLVRIAGFRPQLIYEIGDRIEATFRSRVAQACRVSTARLQTEVFFAKQLYGWEPDASDPTRARTKRYLRVRFPTLQAYRAAARAVVDHVDPYESKVDVSMQFFDRTGIAPCTWFVADLSPVSSRISHCQREWTCAMHTMRPVEREDVAPILVASVDIECYSSTGGFPDADNDEDIISVISTTFWRTNQALEDMTAVIQCVGACDPVQGAYVESYTTERDMLDGWRDLIAVRSMPNVIIGYNIFGFDYKYMADRATRLHCDRFWYSGALIAECGKLDSRELSSNALGQNVMNLLAMPGRTHIDVFHYVKSQYKLQMYSLNSVAEHFLGMNKIDMPYDELFKLVKSDAAGMARVAEYCAEDCRLPTRLLKRLEVMAAMIEMSRVTLTTLTMLVTRGQQIKVFNQIVWHAHRLGYVLNNAPPVRDDEEDGYEGATVIEPTPGFYKDAIATLDFASLYPSIMLAHNLCFSTYVIKPEYMGVADVEYETHRDSHTFVLSTKGVLPAILRHILAARKRAKKDMAKAETSEAKALFNARQLALKVSANSVYGFCGATKRGMYPCLAIADSVTFCGRQMIEKTRTLAEEFIPGARVIYGDSVAEYTPLLARRGDGNLFVATPPSLAAGEWYPTLDGKECATVHDVETWTERGWSAVHFVLRHAIDKPLYRVRTGSGVVDVTADHSLVRSDGTPCTPAECVPRATSLLHAWPEAGAASAEARRGDALLQTDEDLAECMGGIVRLSKGSMPEGLLNADAAAQRAFLDAFFSANARGSETTRAGQWWHARDLAVNVTGERNALILFAILRNLGFVASLSCPRDASRLHTYCLRFRRERGGASTAKAHVVREVRPVPYSGAYVYDLVTENHHFHAGVGELIVHNTDSVMVRMPEGMSNEEAFAIGDKAADHISEQFEEDVTLEMEKVRPSPPFCCPRARGREPHSSRARAPAPACRCIAPTS